MQRQTAVTAYFSSKQLLLFVFARQITVGNHHEARDYQVFTTCQALRERFIKTPRHRIDVVNAMIIDNNHGVRDLSRMIDNDSEDDRFNDSFRVNTNPLNYKHETQFHLAECYEQD